MQANLPGDVKCFASGTLKSDQERFFLFNGITSAIIAATSIMES